MNIPTADQLVGSVPHSLDEESVLRLFLGKTREEALQMFHHVTCTEEFSYMAPTGFLFYIGPAFDYLRSEASRDDWMFVHGLLCSLSCRVSIWGVDATQLSVIREVADYCDANRTKWDVDSDLVDEYLAKIREEKKQPNQPPEPTR